MIKTWYERCEEHPDHNGIVSNRMIQARMQEEIDDLRAAIEQPWQGLTKKEFLAAVDGLEDLEDCWVAIEAKLKEKNTCVTFCSGLGMQNVFSLPCARGGAARAGANGKG